jgi:hypothetical protein
MCLRLENTAIIEFFETKRAKFSLFQVRREKGGGESGIGRFASTRIKNTRKAVEKLEGALFKSIELG